ncbi:C40 family peptidase [Companilactobacillus baiquanensis]|uniref:C40 family peptidase n=1 Tax=Companilactobacillus baiquanensis TaxID=2486005 RepID=A0ABW1UTW6_9LACO|nr:C40 family peptidase [Companilactobacillus baiquanensis]
MNKRIITAFAIGASFAGGILLNTGLVHADTDFNGIVNTTKVTSLYNDDGKLVTNRALAANTPWITDKKIQIGDKGDFYRVSTHEFVKAGDVQLQHGQSENGIVKAGSNGALVYTYDNGDYKSTDRKLSANSAWKYNHIDTIGSKTWYQVSDNGWINSDDASTSTSITNTGVAKVSYAPDSGIDLWQGYGTNKVATGQKLYNGSEWRFDSKVIDSNGDAWYQIGTNQWIEGTYLQITNESFDQAAAEIWDPNFAAVKVNSDTNIYNNNDYNSGKKASAYAGQTLQVDSTLQNGNTTWYEVSNGGWIPSSAATQITTYRSPIVLNGKTKDQAISDVIAAAKQELGKPYVWNAKGPDSFDCSGLMQYVFRQATGQNIGSWTVPQETAGTKVSLSDLQPGDLVFWGPAGVTYHVGLYLGNNQYLNALRPGTNVKIDTISSDFAPSFGVRVIQ